MTLEQTQSLLARLYTDTQFRDSFVRDPAAIGAEWGLTAADACRLAEGCGAEISAFARSLHAKRRQDIAKLLPRTCRVLDVQYASLFDEYLHGIATSGPAASIRDEAVQFAAFVAAHASASGLAEWVCDLARYEGADVRAHRPGRQLLVRSLRWEVGRRRTDEDGWEIGPARRRTLVIWLRWRAAAPLRRWIL